jgi:hypothetical protein
MFACSWGCLTYKKVFVVEVMLMFEDIMTDLLRCYKLDSRGMLLGVSTPGLITHVIGETSLSEYRGHGGEGVIRLGGDVDFRWGTPRYFVSVMCDVCVMCVTKKESYRV